MSIRSTVKAVVVHNGRLLLIKRRGPDGEQCYALPGGGQRQYETMEEAVVRECLEETGYAIFPVGFAALYEEIVDDEEVRTHYPD